MQSPFEIWNVIDTSLVLDLRYDLIYDLQVCKGRKRGNKYMKTDETNA